MKLVLLILFAASLAASLPIISKPLDNNPDPDNLMWDALLTIDTRDTETNQSRKVPKSIFITPNLNESKVPCPAGHKLGPDGKCYKTLNIDPLDILKTQIASLFNRNRTEAYDDYDYSDYSESTESMNEANGQYNVPLSLGFADEQTGQPPNPFVDSEVNDESRIVLGISVDNDKTKQPFLVSAGDVSDAGLKPYFVQTERTDAIQSEAAAQTVAATDINTSASTSSSATASTDSSSSASITTHANDVVSTGISSAGNDAATTEPNVPFTIEIHENSDDNDANSDAKSVDVNTQSTSLPDPVTIASNDDDNVFETGTAPSLRIERVTPRDEKIDIQTDRIDDNHNATPTSNANVDISPVTDTTAESTPSAGHSTMTAQLSSESTKEAINPSTAKLTTTTENVALSEPIVVAAQKQQLHFDTERMSSSSPSTRLGDVEVLPLVQTSASTDAARENTVRPAFEKIQMESDQKNEPGVRSGIDLSTDATSSTAFDEVFRTDAFSAVDNGTENAMIKSSTTEATPEIIVVTDPYDQIDTSASSVDGVSSADSDRSAGLVGANFDFENTSQQDQANGDDDASTNGGEHQIEIIRKSDGTAINDHEYMDDGDNLNDRLAEELLFQGNTMALNKFDNIKLEDISNTSNRSSQADVIDGGDSDSFSGIGSDFNLASNADVTTESIDYDGKVDDIVAIHTDTDSSAYSTLIRSLQSRQSNDEATAAATSATTTVFQTDATQDGANQQQSTAANQSQNPNTAASNTDDAKIDKSIHLGIDCYLKNYYRQFYIMCT